MGEGGISNSKAALTLVDQLDTFVQFIMDDDDDIGDDQLCVT